MRWLRRHWKGALGTAGAALVVLGVGVPFLYIHFAEGDQPAPLSLSTVPSGAAASPVADVAGTWQVSTGSRAGYRVHETLAGQSTTAVGRTSKVSGSLTVTGTQVDTAHFSVPVADIASDRSQRDDQFRGRIMDAARYPTASFRLTKPIGLGRIPPVGAMITRRATGDLTMHGTTRPVTFTVHAKRTASALAVTGDIPVTYGDFHIDNPSFGGFVSVGKTGTVEFLLVTTKR